MHNYIQVKTTETIKFGSLTNDLLPISPNEGNINLLNISNCQATKG